MKALPVKSRTKKTVEEKTVEPVEEKPEVIAVDVSTAKVEPEKPVKQRKPRGLVMKKTI